MADRPNILLFFTDDQRFDVLGCRSDGVVATPHLDALAARGCRFDRAHIPGGTSGAVCMPSRAMLHTGRGLFRIEGAGQGIPTEHILLGEHLRAAGYTCFGTGKWHNGTASYARSFDDGDAIFFGGMEDHWNVPVHRFDPTGRYDGRLPMVRAPMQDNRVLMRHADTVHPGVHSSELFADATISFLDRRDTDHPFFAYVSLMAPHDPRTMPEGFRRRYDPADVELPPNFMHQHPFDTGSLTNRDEKLAGYPRHADEIRRHIAEYYAMITHLDHEFGRLMDALAERDLLDDTVVAMAGDNGLAVGQHGLMGKQNLYDHSVRVPLIMAGPGVPAGARTDALCHLCDVFPTLCDLAGVEIPGSVESRSLAPVLADPGASGRDELYLAYVDTIRGLRAADWKLIEYAGPSGPATQLFDLAADPWEMCDRSGDPACADRLAAMRRRLPALAREEGDLDTGFGRDYWAKRPDLAG